MVDRPVHTQEEIEISPEMIEAGIYVLYEFDLFSVAKGWDTKGEVVRAVLGAVFRVVRADQRTIGASI